MRESPWGAWRVRLIWVLGAIGLVALISGIVSGTYGVELIGVLKGGAIDCGSLFAPIDRFECTGMHDDELPIVLWSGIAFVVCIAAVVAFLRLKPARSSGHPRRPA